MKGVRTGIAGRDAGLPLFHRDGSTRAPWGPGGAAGKCTKTRVVQGPLPRAVSHRCTTNKRWPSTAWSRSARPAPPLLLRNLAPAGMLPQPGPEASERGYLAVFGRDAAVCAIGMALAGDATLEREAPAGLVTLARYQARNGQIPKFVDVNRAEADFWYLGCIDATLWWLIAVAWLDRHDPRYRLRQTLAANVEKAIVWLECQEHQRFFLLQQNEASDWADIMPRSGFVLYTKALWYLVKPVTDCPGTPRRVATSTRCSIRSRRAPPSTGAHACSPTTCAIAPGTATCT